MKQAVSSWLLQASHSLLRPEAVEPLFLLHQAFGDPKYEEWRWRIFGEIEHTTNLGYQLGQRFVGKHKQAATAPVCQAFWLKLFTHCYFALSLICKWPVCLARLAMTQDLLPKLDTKICQVFCFLLVECLQPSHIMDRSVCSEV